MALSVTSQTLSVSGVASSVMTPAVPDPDTGGYVREFRFLGPDEEVLLVVRVAAETQSAISVTTPPLEV